MNKFSLSLVIALVPFAIGLSIIQTGTAHSPAPIPPVETPPEQVPGQTNGKPTLEMVFVLDTTGSMGGLLEGAKQRIWGIVNEVMRSASHPAVRVGLVAYRDRGDEYVTK